MHILDVIDFYSSVTYIHLESLTQPSPERSGTTNGNHMGICMGPKAQTESLIDVTHAQQGSLAKTR